MSQARRVSLSHHKLIGPFNELYEITRGGAAATEGPFAVRDAEVLSQLLTRFLDDPRDREVIRRALGASYEGGLDARSLATEMGQRIAAGELELQLLRGERMPRVLPGVTSGGAGEIIDISNQDEVVVEADWWWECEHHASPDGARGQTGRSLFHTDETNSRTQIDVVPSVGKTKDVVKLHWKDTEMGSPPRADVDVMADGKTIQVPAGGGSGGYATYAIDATYNEDIDLLAFFLPQFWTDFKKTTMHRVGRGPASLEVRVFNPRKYKFEFSMPPLRAYKRGYKLGEEGSADPRKLASPKNLKKKLEEEKTGWGPPSVPLPAWVNTQTGGLGVNRGAHTRESEGWARQGQYQKKDSNPTDAATGNTEYGATGAALNGAAGKAKISTLKLTRDSLVLDPPGILTTIAECLRLYRLIQGIISKIQDYAPQVGFYMEIDLQLLQGGLAVEWMHKEHTDHRAYLAWDVNLKLTIVKIGIEIGIGISGAGCKLQIFAQVEGELALEGGYKRESPDSETGFELPMVKGKITGAIGARAEAGSFVKLEAKGESAVELEVHTGINIESRPVRLGCRARWTGIELSATASAQALGVGYSKSWKNVIMEPSGWVSSKWPSDKPYVPPTMSRAAISQRFQMVLTDGWDVRVFDSADDHVSVTRVGNMLADKVLGDRGFDKTPKDIEALANSVRKDLDALSERWGRDWLSLVDLRAYINGTVRGRSLSKHLAAGQVDPLLATGTA